MAYFRRREVVQPVQPVAGVEAVQPVQPVQYVEGVEAIQPAPVVEPTVRRTTIINEADHEYAQPVVRRNNSLLPVIVAILVALFAIALFAIGTGSKGDGGDTKESNKSSMSIVVPTTAEDGLS